MRVVLDGYWWIQGPSALRSIERDLALEWARQFPEDHLAIVIRRKDLSAASEQLKAAGFTIFTTRLWPQGLAAAFSTWRVARRWRATTVLTHNFAPIRGGVVFIQDLMFLERRSWFTWPERIYFSAMAPLARRARLVLASTVTEASRIKRFVRSTPVRAVGVGLSSELLHADSIKPDVDLRAGSFVLTVGRLNARKNLGRMIDAALLSGVIDSERPLVVVGEKDGAQEGLSDAAKLAIANGSIRLCGHVSIQNLRWLYEHACVTMCMSLDEGCGLTPMESLSLGTPVVVSDIDVFHENLGDLAVYADPTSRSAIAEALRLVLAADYVTELTSGDGYAHDAFHLWPDVVARIRAEVMVIEAQ